MSCTSSSHFSEECRISREQKENAIKKATTWSELNYQHMYEVVYNVLDVLHPAAYFEHYHDRLPQSRDVLQQHFLALLKVGAESFNFISISQLARKDRFFKFKLYFLLLIRLRTADLRDLDTHSADSSPNHFHNTIP